MLSTIVQTFIVWALLAVSLAYIWYRFRKSMREDITKGLQDQEILQRTSRQAQQLSSHGVETQWKDCWCVQDWKSKDILSQGGAWFAAETALDTNLFIAITFRTEEEAWQYAVTLMAQNPMARLEAKKVLYIAP